MHVGKVCFVMVQNIFYYLLDDTKSMRLSKWDTFAYRVDNFKNRFIKILNFITNPLCSLEVL